MTCGVDNFDPEPQRSQIHRLRVEGFTDTRIIAGLVGLRDDSLVWAAIEAESSALDRACARHFVAVLDRARTVARVAGFVGSIDDLIDHALCEYAGRRGAVLAPRPSAQRPSEAAA